MPDTHDLLERPRHSRSEWRGPSQSDCSASRVTPPAPHSRTLSLVKHSQNMCDVFIDNEVHGVRESAQQDTSDFAVLPRVLLGASDNAFQCHVKLDRKLNAQIRALEFVPCGRGQNIIDSLVPKPNFDQFLSSLRRTSNLTSAHDRPASGCSRYDFRRSSRIRRCSSGTDTGVGSFAISSQRRCTRSIRASRGASLNPGGLSSFVLMVPNCIRPAKSKPQWLGDAESG